jgi:hypothetical protein
MSWSLSELLAGLHKDIERRLETARKAIGHPVTKGDASERVWINLLQTYLPKRYQTEKAHVVDSTNAFSDQLDLVVFDRQYSPLIFHHEGQTIIPAESVYAVFESKQSINAEQVEYAQKKIASVRRLYRTSLPVPTAGGTLQPRETLPSIIGGLLTLESDWTPPLGKPLDDALAAGDAVGRLDIGCVAAHGMFGCDERGCYTMTLQGKPTAAFLLELIARLQVSGTVPMIDVRAYTRWLTE